MGAILNQPDIDNLIFFHIPKCAGTTFLFILNRQYAHLKHFDIKPLAPDALNTELFIDLPESKRKEYNLIKGHQEFGLHKYLNGKTYYITFVRHPVQRISSFYHFAKNHPDNRLYPFIHKYNFTLKDFVLKFNDHDINNGQINRLGGIPFEEETIQLEKALENIKNYFPIVGLVKKFDESLMLMRNFYHWKWPYYAVVNKNKKKPKKKISLALQELILEKNQGDLKLYHAMQARLENQINNSEENIEKQLRKFKQINKLFVHRHMFSAYSKVRKII